MHGVATDVPPTPTPAPAHPFLAELLALIESEAVNPGPIVSALEKYLLSLLPVAAAAPDKAALRACCAKHGV